jgi:hypothetical protein
MTVSTPADEEFREPATTGDGGVFRWCLAVFLVAFAVRVLLIFATKSYLQTGKFELERVAWSLATRGEFADAYAEGSGPSAHAAPLYPLLLAAVYRVFGKDWAGTLVQELLSSCLASLQYALLPLLARVCGMPVVAGAIGGLLAAILPANRATQAKGSFEYALSALWLAVFALLVIRIWNERRFPPGNAVLLGALTGLIMLTAPHAGPLFAGVALTGFGLFLRSVPPRRLVAFVAIQAVIAAVMLVPWTVRNQLVLGAPIWSRSNVGMELALSNNDEASPIWEENMKTGLFHRMHPFTSAADLARVRELGEVGYNREKMTAATRWIRSHPGRFAELTALRAILFWFPNTYRPKQMAVLYAITLAGLAGFTCFAPRRTPAVWFFAALWLCYPLSSYFFQMSARPRYPIEWSLFLFAGYLAYLAWGRFPRRGAAGPTAA